MERHGKSGCKTITKPMCHMIMLIVYSRFRPGISENIHAHGRSSLSGFRVFGNGGAQKPASVELHDYCEPRDKALCLVEMETCGQCIRVSLFT
jgi:hypothetical protein